MPEFVTIEAQQSALVQAAREALPANASDSLSDEDILRMLSRVVRDQLRALEGAAHPPVRLVNLMSLGPDFVTRSAAS